jgi:hypothetical protein
LENDYEHNTDCEFRDRLYEPEDNDNQYGWFEHKRVVGTLWFKGKELVDYDGIADYIPKEVLDALETIGFDVNEMRPTGE